MLTEPLLKLSCLLGGSQYSLKFSLISIHLPLESLIVIFKLIIYLSMYAALEVKITKGRVKENLIHRLRNMDEVGD